MMMTIGTMTTGGTIGLAAAPAFCFATVAAAH